MTDKIGIADTMFAIYNMGNLAEKILRKYGEGFKKVRYTVPGIKDLPVACKKLIEDDKCNIVLALGMPGSKPIDKQCAHEASVGIMNVQLMTNTHVLEIFVHEDEAKSNKELVKIFEDRIIKHTINALELLKGKDALTRYAGKGRRQGQKDKGQII